MTRTDNKKYFESIIQQHKGILYKVARAYCPAEDDRQDLIQEMMIQIWQSLHRYNDQFNITTWLYRIALNVAISFYRKHQTKEKRYAVLHAGVLHFPADAPSDDEQQFQLLEKFICELKEIDRALMLLYLEDKTHAEMGEILGISVSNVGTKIGRIKDRLKLRFLQVNHNI